MTAEPAMPMPHGNDEPGKGEAFMRLVRKLVAVPKHEVDAARKREAQERRPRKSS